MITITLYQNNKNIRLAVDLGVEGTLDSTFHFLVVSWVENNYPRATICGYSVFPSDQKSQWLEMVEFLRTRNVYV